MTTAPANRTGRKLMTEAEALRELRGHATVSIATAGAACGIGRERAYAAADRGDLPVIRLAGERRVISAKLLDMLGLGLEPPANSKSEGDAP